jgi:hypothetical protein
MRPCPFVPGPPLVGIKTKVQKAANRLADDSIGDDFRQKVARRVGYIRDYGQLPD